MLIHQTGFQARANDNFNQRGRVYCYLKATYSGGDLTAECRDGLGALKAKAGQWAVGENEGGEEEEEGGQAKKKAKRVPWGEKAATLAKHAAEGHVDDLT